MASLKHWQTRPLASSSRQRRATQDVPAAMAEPGAAPRAALESQKGLRDILFALRPLVLEDGGLGPPATRAGRAHQTVRMGRAWSRVASMRPGDLLRRWKRRVHGDPRSGQQRDQDRPRGPRSRSTSMRTETRSSRCRGQREGVRCCEHAPGYASRGSLGVLQMRNRRASSARSCRSTRVRVKGRACVSGSPSHDRPIGRGTAPVHRARREDAALDQAAFAEAFVALSDGIVLTDADGLVMSANPARSASSARNSLVGTVFESSCLSQARRASSRSTPTPCDARGSPRGGMGVLEMVSTPLPGGRVFIRSATSRAGKSS